MPLDRKKLKIVRMVILLALWGICAFFVVKLSVDYVETGRKNTIDIETELIEDLSVPWLYAPTVLGDKCALQLEECLFQKTGIEGSKVINCTTAVKTPVGENSYIVNSVLLRELGIGFTNPLDYLKVVFTVRYNDTRELVDPTFSIPTECDFYSSESSTWVTLLGDDVIMNAIAQGKTINERDMNAPIYIGFGNVASISYKLSQQQYINGTIKNSTEFATTQFSDVAKNTIVVHVQPASFDITKIKHKTGQSFLDLLGSIFGWIGVFTGACIFSVLDTAIAAYGKAEISKNDFFEEGNRKFVTDTELCEKDDSASSTREVMEEIRMLRAEVGNLKFRGNTPTPSFTAPTPTLETFKAP